MRFPVEYSIRSCGFPFVAQIKIAGSLQKSTEIMKMVNSLVKLPEIAGAMQEMSAEMMKVRSLICCIFFYFYISFHYGRPASLRK